MGIAWAFREQIGRDGGGDDDEIRRATRGKTILKSFYLLLVEQRQNFWTQEQAMEEKKKNAEKRGETLHDGWTPSGLGAVAAKKESRATANRRADGQGCRVRTMCLEAREGLGTEFGGRELVKTFNAWVGILHVSGVCLFG